MLTTDHAHGVPYLWSDTGIGYNEAQVHSALGGTAPVESLTLIFDPAVAAKLAPCGISLLDTPQEVFPAALPYLGLDPKSRDLGDLDKAFAALEKIRPYIRKFHSSQYINDLANGDLCVALGYSGDVVQARNRAREAGNEVALGLPRPEGRGDDVGRHARNTRRCSASGERTVLYRLPTASRGDRRHHQRGLLPEPEFVGDGAGPNPRSATIRRSTRRRMCAAGFMSTCRRPRTTNGRARAPGRGSNRAACRREWHCSKSPA